MNSLGPEHEMSDAEKEKLALLCGDDTPMTLLYGAGGSGKTVMPLEDYDELAARLTADDYDIKGTGRVLRGEEAAAYGRAVLEESVGGPDGLAELMEKLAKEKRQS